MTRNCKIAVALAAWLMLWASSITAGEKKEVEVKVVKDKTTVTITAQGKAGYHCNTLYPWKLIVEGPSQEKKTYTKTDAKTFSEEAVVFQAPNKKGQKATLKMSVCNETQCIMHTEELSW